MQTTYKALKLLLTAEQPQNVTKFPDLTEFRAKIPPNKSASINMLTAMRDTESSFFGE